MAYTSGPNRGVETDIFVTGADLSGGTAIAPNPGVDESPSLSPDGTRVAWMSDRGGSRSIWVANVDGSGTPLKLTNINGAGNPEWSPDSTKLAYEVPDNTSGLTQITVRSADGSGGPLVLTGGRANREPTWSPDGKEIAWMRAGDGGFGFDVWVMNASDGTGKRQLTGTGNARGPSWSPDGKFVAFHLDSTVRVIPKDEVAGFGTPLRIPDNTVSEVNRAAAWQTLPTFPECLDSDGDDDSDDDDDALCDNWEETGLDWDRDGTVDLTLPGAQREHRDLYVELDHMADHFPGPNAINDVVAAFANAPATPAANAGITLHVEVGNAMPESASIAFPGCTGAAGGGDADFDTLKSANFGTPAQRSAGVAVLGAKRYAYRYGVYAHTLLGRPDQSGCSELPGNDFIVTLGSGARVVAGGHRVGSRNQQSGTLMHEFGHTLGLRHGGSTDVNCKPNYLSVMNYTRQFDGVPIVGRPLDYSRTVVDTLDELSLAEPAGIDGPAGSLFAHPASPITVSSGTAPVDWNNDGDTDDIELSLNVNRIPDLGCNDANKTSLVGFDDWANLVYDFQNTDDFADGAHSSAAEVDEVTFAELAAVAPDTDGDGVSNLDDNCLTVANADQADADADGAGNACGTGVTPGPKPGPGPGPPTRARGRSRPLPRHRRAHGHLRPAQAHAQGRDARRQRGRRQLRGRDARRGGDRAQGRQALPVRRRPRQAGEEARVLEARLAEGQGNVGVDAQAVLQAAPAPRDLRAQGPRTGRGGQPAQAGCPHAQAPLEDRDPPRRARRSTSTAHADRAARRR